MKRLDSGTLDALEKVAKSGRELHPVDAQRLIDEVRAYQAVFDGMGTTLRSELESEYWSPGVTGSDLWVEGTNPNPVISAKMAGVARQIMKDSEMAEDQTLEVTYTEILTPGGPVRTIKDIAVVPNPIRVNVSAHVTDPASPEPVGETTFTVGPDGKVTVFDPDETEQAPNKYVSFRGPPTDPVFPDKVGYRKEVRWGPNREVVATYTEIIPPVSSKEGSGAEPDVTVTEPK